MDGIKDKNEVKHGCSVRLVQEYAKKGNRILREINKKAINVSPKIFDRSSLTHINKNTGQGTSRNIGLKYGNPNVPPGSWESQMERFDLDDEIKKFLTPRKLGKDLERQFRIFSKDIQRKSRAQQSRSTKSDCGRKKKKSSQSNLSRTAKLLESASGAVILAPKKIENMETEQSSQKNTSRPRLKLLSALPKEFNYKEKNRTKKGLSQKKLKKEKKKARP
ncbi:unnamed protein product [Oikopleura dioica]|uniref:Uncharacterized protein n=1 Tax=Oikopleura dioica TaxID=34765 RepID=E4XHK5_OIKDI|nr:unnamed protein product [Oikopleura dioica]